VFFGHAVAGVTSVQAERSGTITVWAWRAQTRGGPTCPRFDIAMQTHAGIAVHQPGQTNAAPGVEDHPALETAGALVLCGSRRCNGK